ncbi:MAG: geranylgeranylglyceryl/heptaprenylglyceryl phosphate synthase [Bacteroidetes bacterium]|jgi:putative glycerol-1-phosphate prenyltransferase|nr:geranylgeranylglyceryl/heptaprenylglyceryl phosphate synthase [Bacteroidota bacterium]MBV6462201.1 Geranylgeranylglyceryl phosphate synthase [Flavobacteriales bacterium]WKZ74785.1 MAG: geranylgeranylglyceryl/heptaprenylglyceryl phosphate synthase [Vicingaceae bacterium]MCL4816011.1 geranylgeranylglyceryl/heptaprenylglyceryl phosphate synthase [Flavobacteriales bacterium]NOG95169.1 geranylgeranylglyceryl/heptaprenylglyceryl phosphate synthase [Bacteroidota bacterium]
MTISIFDTISTKTKQGKKQLAVLIDPDKCSAKHLETLFAKQHFIDFFLVGGSLITRGDFSKTISLLKEFTQKPVIIFPGNNLQIAEEADAILFLSLISGRNAELLIGQHVAAAPHIQKINLETIPTGYMLIESGQLTTAIYLSASLPIPRNKKDVACATALAGEYLGLKLIYMDAGSGANNTVPADMISAVKKTISIPLFVGGGIRTAECAFTIYNAGADVIVIGNKAERHVDFLDEMAAVKEQIKSGF